MTSDSKRIAPTSLSVSLSEWADEELEILRVRFRLEGPGLGIFGDELEGEDGGDEPRKPNNVFCLNFWGDEYVLRL